MELVLDVVSAGRDPQRQASRNYLYDAPKDPELLAFHPIPLSFEPVEPGRCSPVFKVYRKEYKRRFAWIRAGRISDTDFYAWSEQTREMKKKCDRDIITPEEFQARQLLVCFHHIIAALA